MENNSAGWFEIYAQDMDRAQKVCESVFQIKLERRNNPEPELWGFPMNNDNFLKHF